MSHELFQVCIDTCNDCVSACEECATSCSNEGDGKQAECIELNRYCADMCGTAASFLARLDKHTIGFVSKFCSLCAEICNACATECEKHPGMEHCRTCAEACRRCAVECIKMTKSTPVLN
ncbi:MAG TPA: four-helix bundle copper-binding protein [Bacteroidia bacterium]|nr:four-helix bundle copper-binding protein [Bacteroidia bacterium]